MPVVGLFTIWRAISSHGVLERPNDMEGSDEDDFDCTLWEGLGTAFAYDILWFAPSFGFSPSCLLSFLLFGFRLPNFLYPQRSVR